MTNEDAAHSISDKDLSGRQINRITQNSEPREYWEDNNPEIAVEYEP